MTEQDRSVTSATSRDRPGDPDFMLSLARGLSVLKAIVHARAPVSIAELAKATGLPRAAVRRCVHTLRLIDYAAEKAGGTGVGPGFASLAAAYSGSSALVLAAQPILDGLRDELGLTVSLGILSGGNAVYLARATDGRRWQSSIPLGGEVPAYCTALGRILLAHCAGAEVQDYLAATPLVARTPKTVTSPEPLLAMLDEARRQGFAIVDQELEIGLRAIAVPVRDASGKVIAAINVATQPVLVGLRQLKARILPRLLEASCALTLHLE